MTSANDVRCMAYRTASFLNNSLTRLNPTASSISEPYRAPSNTRLKATATELSASQLFASLNYKFLDHDFLNVPACALDRECRCGIGNQQQDLVYLRFSLYQGAKLPVLSDASYRSHAVRRCNYQQTSCRLQKPRCRNIQKFHVSLDPFQTSLSLRPKKSSMKGDVKRKCFP